jgi:hypothetical protein
VHSLGGDCGAQRNGENAWVTKRTLTQIEHDRRTRSNELRRVHESKAEQARAVFKKWKVAVEEAVEKNRPAPPMPAEADAPADFVEPRLHISNATVEKIAVLLKARPRGMLMIVDELAGLFILLQNARPELLQADTPGAAIVNSGWKPGTENTSSLSAWDVSRLS